MRISDWSSDVCSSDLLARGRERLAALFGPRSLPVMVPPWNRIDAALAERLPGLGFAALSTYQARTTATAAPGLVQTNCHLDILRWKPERRFLGTEDSLGLMTDHLAATRPGTAAATAPTGTPHQPPA